VRISRPEEHIAQAPPRFQTTYRYDCGAGINQNIYVLDTGVRKDHVNLHGVKWLANFFGTGEIDDHGHGSFPFPLQCSNCLGTAVAGVIRSDLYGVLAHGKIKVNLSITHAE
jgi:hypothetical protein